MRSKARRILLNRMVAGATASLLWRSALSAREGSDAGEERRERPLIGAIRWDAWYDPADGAVAKAVEKTLTPVPYRHRMPFFGTVTASNAVRINGYSQDIIDREIDMAANAGLDYWAFDTYPPGSPLGNALQLYLSSRHRDRLRFCAINALSSTIPYFAAQTDYLMDLICQPGYVLVEGQRPLFFAYTISDTQIAADGGIALVADWVQQIRIRARRDGPGDPYIVLTQEGDLTRAALLCSQLGLDAVAQYATAIGPFGGAPFVTLAKLVEAFWDQQVAATGFPIIPNVMTGWDTRPLSENPVPWEPQPAPDHYYQPATPDEIARHLERALLWLKTHRSAAPANTALMYAWNECSEGFGALVPTYDPEGPSGDPSRLRAIASVLMTD
ncbi:MAG: hypothetical protein JO133_06965 [Burkholderiaceae bacterium]|nr:hypothetical protein [Burkholderiaceae bacterium]